MSPIHHTSGDGGGQRPPLLAAGIILFRRADDGTPRFLLLETRKGGHYSPPKGHLDPGETFEAGARRETIEECGLEARALDPAFQVEVAYDVMKKGAPRRKRVVYFLGEATPGEVVLSGEHLSARWADLAEVERLVEFETLLRVYRRAAAHLAGGPRP